MLYINIMFIRFIKIKLDFTEVIFNGNQGNDRRT
jgi:hypothetical protein